MCKRISGPTHPNFTNVYVALPAVLLWFYYNMLLTSGRMDDITFADNWPGKSNTSRVSDQETAADWGIVCCLQLSCCCLQCSAVDCIMFCVFRLHMGALLDGYNTKKLEPVCC